MPRPAGTTGTPPRRPARAGALAALALGALGLAAAARPTAGAASDFPTELKTIESVRFEGRHHVSRRDLEAALKTKAPSFWPWSRAPLLRVDFLRADSASVEQVYHQHGFLDVRAGVRLDPGHHTDAVIVTFLIHEGPRSRIATVGMDGVHAVPEASLRRRLYARPGRAFNPLYLIADTTRIADVYREHGYLPSVGALATRRADSVDVRYVIEEGPRFRFGQANLSSPGDLRVKPRLILRELVYRPGEIYKASLVQESIEQIYRTGLFSQVQMTPLPDSTNGVVEFELRVRERRPRWLDAGIGSGTSERLRVTGEWGHRNINARGLQTVVSSKVAFDGHAKFLLARLEGTLYDPWVLGARRRGLASVYYENRHDRANPSFVVRQEGRGVSFQIRREYRGRTRLTVTQDNAYVRQRFTGEVTPEAADTLVQNYSTHRITLGIDRDNRDDPLNPFRGSYHTFTGDIAGGPLRGTSSFTRLQTAVTWYLPVRRSSVLAIHGRVGAIDPFGKAQAFVPGDLDPRVARVPLEDRFRIGGVNTLRGYNENALPASGGLALLQANLELRVPLIGPLGAEVFVDAGNVWARPSYVRGRDLGLRFSDAPYGPGDVRYVGGVGLRLNLPIGPLRYDVSWAARPDGERDRRPRSQFAIGPAF